MRYLQATKEEPYTIEDWPYGRTLRCKMRIWVESHPKRGFRTMRQTSNPRTGDWNKPKGSNYSLLGAGFIIDEEGKLSSHGIGEYSSAEQVLEFAQHFGATPTIKEWVLAKIAYLRKSIAGEAYFTINGKRAEYTKADKVRHESELVAWEAIPLDK